MNELQKRQCRSCKADVYFVRSAASRQLMPINAEPDPKGTIVLDENGDAVVLSGSMFEKPPTGPRYTSHFATCPKAGEWRRKPRPA